MRFHPRIRNARRSIISTRTDATAYDGDPSEYDRYR